MFATVNTISACLSALLLTSGVSAYTNNCQGSSKSPNIGNCDAGLATINPSATYSDQAQFSTGDCYIIYATNNAGAQPVSGQVIINTVKTILEQCGSHHGSYGTNNCEKCHVTVNYRAPKKMVF